MIGNFGSFPRNFIEREGEKNKFKPKKKRKKKKKESKKFERKIMTFD